MSLNEVYAKHSKRLGRRELSVAFVSWANGRKIFSIYLVHLRRDLGNKTIEIYDLVYMKTKEQVGKKIMEFKTVELKTLKGI